MTFHRKIGGIHWFTIGRIRIAFCIKRSKPVRLLPIAKWDAPLRLSATHTQYEANHYVISKH